MIYLLFGYLIILNLCGALAMRADKRRAKAGRWRIPEKTLFLLAILGGSLGCIYGMFHYRHKTQHLSFRIGMPIILFAQVSLAAFLSRFFF